MSDAPVNVTPESVEAPQRPTQVKSKRGRRLMIIIIILLLLGLAAITAVLISFVAPRAGVATQTEAKGIDWVKSIYGWGDSPDSQLSVPQEVSLDEAGNIWVSDTRYADKLLVFSPEGRLVKTVGQDSPQRIVSIGPSAVHEDGRVFLGESALDRVRVFDPQGTDLGFFTIPNPVDIATDGADRLVIGSTSGFAIVNPDTGAPIKVVGERGQGDGQFDTVNGVAVGQDGRIYVVDGFNNRLSAFNAEGERIWMVQTGAPGNKVDLSGGGAMAASRQTTAPAALQLPADITIDGRGRLIVADSLDFSVSVFDPKDGKFLAKYGDYGAKDGNFVYPSSIAYDAARDWFVVADAGNSRVQIIRIPDSAAQGGAAAAARRALAGPLRACLFPLILLLILVIVMVWRSRRRKKQERLASQAAASRMEFPEETIS